MLCCVVLHCAHQLTFLTASLPQYCAAPSEEADRKMQEWVASQLLVRCHLTRLWVPCTYRPYQNYIPCRQAVADALAEDFAVSKRWCDFTSATASIPLLQVNRHALVKSAFQKPAREKPGIRIAFFFIVHTETLLVARVLNRLYSASHYYLIHVDRSNTASASKFESQFSAAMMGRTNVHVTSSESIVYGTASTAVLLTKALAWFHTHATGWDYIVSLTGSDYPLLPLERMETILSTQFRASPQPFIMAWSQETQSHIDRLCNVYDVFRRDPLLRRSIDVLSVDR